MTDTQFEERVKELIGKKPFYSTRDLINTGIFGSKRGVYDAIKKDGLETYWVSPQRRVITRESLIRHLMNMNDE